MKIEEILAYITCPCCTSEKLRLKTKNKLVCQECGNFFRAVEGIPILMKEEELGEQEKKQIKWFNKHYSEFSGEKYRLENWRLSMVNRIFNVGFQEKIKTYLDIGCGATGYTTIEAAKRLGCISFGIDISLEAMLRAKRLAQKQDLEERTAFIVCSAENLPFKPNLFDYVSAISLLEHLENDTQVVKSVSKIVKRSGHFYVCVPNTYKRMWPFLWPIYFYLDKRIGHKRHYSIEDLNKRMERGSFRPERVFYNGHLIKLLQLVLEKGQFIGEELWWNLEEKDINQNSMGIQLNAIYRKS